MLGGPMWRSLHTTLFRSCHYGVVVKCYASGQCGPSLIPGWCRSWSRRLQSNQPKKISSSKNIFRFQLLKFKLGKQNKIIVTLTSNKLLEWSCAIDSLFLIDRNQLRYVLAEHTCSLLTITADHRWSRDQRVINIKDGGILGAITISYLFSLVF